MTDNDKDYFELGEVSQKPTPALDKRLMLGHRERMRERFIKSKDDFLQHYELLEMILYSSIPRKDTKQLAKELIHRFGSFADVINADPKRLRSIKGIGDKTIFEFKILKSASKHLIRSKIIDMPIITAWMDLIDYCRSEMAYIKKEQFRIIFLNKKNCIISDEVQQEGTIDHTPVYPREIMKRALELSATAVILVHNHPSGDPSPSKSDIRMTKQIIEAGKALNIVVHDHIIIASDKEVSFKNAGLLNS